MLYNYIIIYKINGVKSKKMHLDENNLFSKNQKEIKNFTLNSLRIYFFSFKEIFGRFCLAVASFLFFISCIFFSVLIADFLVYYLQLGKSFFTMLFFRIILIFISMVGLIYFILFLLPLCLVKTYSGLKMIIIINFTVLNIIENIFLFLNIFLFYYFKNNNLLSDYKFCYYIPVILIPIGIFLLVIGSFSLILSLRQSYKNIKKMQSINGKFNLNI